MKISSVYAIYFSPTGNTKHIALTISHNIAKLLGVPVYEHDFTSSKIRAAIQPFTSCDYSLNIIAIPTYAGRIPNKILPYIQNNLIGQNSICVPIVTFGNRNFDYSLAELCYEIKKNGFIPIAAAAIVAPHVFSNIISHDRPDCKDLKEIEEFTDTIIHKINSITDIENLHEPLCLSKYIANNINFTYYTPLQEDGSKAEFLKAKPKTKTDRCISCGYCSDICPMGSIDKNDFSLINGICIKCQACVLKCPQHAKYFDDKAFLSHIKMLEKNYLERMRNTFFID